MGAFMEAGVPTTFLLTSFSGKTLSIWVWGRSAVRMAKYQSNQRRVAEAVIAHLSSIQIWQTITEEFGLSGAEVGQAWAIGTLIRDVPSTQSSQGGRQT